MPLTLVAHATCHMPTTLDGRRTGIAEHFHGAPCRINPGLMHHLKTWLESAYVWPIHWRQCKLPSQRVPMRRPMPYHVWCHDLQPHGGPHPHAGKGKPSSFTRCTVAWMSRLYLSCCLIASRDKRPPRRFAWRPRASRSYWRRSALSRSSAIVTFFANGLVSLKTPVRGWASNMKTVPNLAATGLKISCHCVLEACHNFQRCSRFCQDS